MTPSYQVPLARRSGSVKGRYLPDRNLTLCGSHQLYQHNLEPRLQELKVLKKADRQILEAFRRIV